MNVRPLFWMMVGAGATLVGGAWGGRQFLPIPSESQQDALAKTAVQMEAAVRPNSAYAAENVLRRTPWIKPKADPFGEKPAVVPRAVAPVVVIREPPPLVFPFVYVGKLIADGKETLFLSKGNQIYPVAEGATLEGLYRVERIGSDSIELSYIPDARKMTFTLGTITAKQVPGAATVLPNSVVGSIAQPPPEFFGGAGVPQPIMTQPPVDSGEMSAESQQMMELPFPTEDAQQSAAAPIQPLQPPVSMPPGMIPPEMLPSGMDPSGIIPPGVPQ